MSQIYDAIVVGAGQAGLGIGYFLKQAGCKFIVLERGEIGNTWRTQRWESFAVNTPNWSNGLPGLPYDGSEPDGFWLRDELVTFFERYAAVHKLHVETGMTVKEVSVDSTKDGFKVVASENGGSETTYFASNVIVASGILQTKKIPSIQKNVPKNILQLHTADYRSPEQLPSGAVLVVGSGQSGCQIVEDLIPSGRKIYLCTSKVGRLPRRYRGRDFLEWWVDSGFFDVTLDEVEDHSVTRMAQPQISGVGRYGHTVSLQQLAKQGVTILGRLQDVQNGQLLIADDVGENVAFADQFSTRMKVMTDEYIQKSYNELPPLDPDPADEPDTEAAGANPARQLDIEEAGIKSIIWATGFTGTFEWLRVPVLHANGLPIHKRGVSPVPGVYFIGFPWLHRRKSGIIYGIEDDARYLVQQIEERIAKHPSNFEVK